MRKALMALMALVLVASLPTGALAQGQVLGLGLAKSSVLSGQVRALSEEELDQTSCAGLPVLLVYYGVRVVGGAIIGGAAGAAISYHNKGYIDWDYVAIAAAAGAVNGAFSGLTGRLFPPPPR